MIKLNIRYGREFEINRIKNTLSKINWYTKHGYKPLLPEEVNLENVRRIIENEFNEKEYEEAKKELLNNFSLKIYENIEKKIGKNLPEEIIVFLTKYGVGGSYNLPNIVVINIRIKHKPLIEILRHEIVHLLIEDEVQKKGLTHEQKEKLVEEFLS